MYPGWALKSVFPSLSLLIGGQNLPYTTSTIYGNKLRQNQGLIAENGGGKGSSSDGVIDVERWILRFPLLENENKNFKKL
jgi:hypothetical protein